MQAHASTHALCQTRLPRNVSVPGATSGRSVASLSLKTRKHPSSSRVNFFKTRPSQNGRTSTTIQASAAPVETKEAIFPSEQLFSGLEGKALLNAQEKFPTKREIMSKIPEHCFKKDTIKSLAYAAASTALCLAIGAAAYMYIPMTAAWTPAWLAYAIVQGTAGTGCWVIAHECGHGAFSDNGFIQDLVGYVLHTALLVPYFSWQRSHAVHHSRTNHIEEGETHVPTKATNPKAQATYDLREKVGEDAFAIVHTTVSLFLGWPMYLLTGASGGPVRGKTNHFYPTAGAEGRHALFPGPWKEKVWWSDVGIFAVLGFLGYAAYLTSPMTVMAMYVGPYMFTNLWLVLYTWLQHTDVDVPHFGNEEWSWSKGTFMTIDRPYGWLCDTVHHHIGSTHVVHHLNHQIPHYHGKEATEAIKAAYPQLYLYDPTPIFDATVRVARKCIAVEEVDDGSGSGKKMWVWRNENPVPASA